MWQCSNCGATFSEPRGVCPGCGKFLYPATGTRAARAGSGRGIKVFFALLGIVVVLFILYKAYQKMSRDAHNLGQNIKITTLVAAAECGDVAQVEARLVKNADIDAKVHMKNIAHTTPTHNEWWQLGEVTPLIIAAERGHLDVVRLLIKKGADIDERSSFGYTALMLAMERGHADIVHALLDAGVRIEAKNVFGTTTRMLAQKHGYNDIAGGSYAPSKSGREKTLDNNEEIVALLDLSPYTSVEKARGRSGALLTDEARYFKNNDDKLPTTIRLSDLFPIECVWERGKKNKFIKMNIYKINCAQLNEESANNFAEMLNELALLRTR